MKLIGKFRFRRITKTDGSPSDRWMAESRREGPDGSHLMAIGSTLAGVKEYATLATSLARTGHFEQLSARHPKWYRRDWTSCWSGHVPPHKRLESGRTIIKPGHAQIGNYVQDIT